MHLSIPFRSSNMGRNLKNADLHRFHPPDQLPTWSDAFSVEQKMQVSLEGKISRIKFHVNDKGTG